MVNKYVHANSSVLELGSRYGVVSCAIARKLGNSGKQVSVEPDHKVQEANKFNQKANGCKYNLEHGAVSKEPMDSMENFISLGESTMKSSKKSGSNAFTLRTKTPQLSIDGLEKKYSLNFDTLVADCEGCVIDVLKENPELVNKLHTVILEIDFNRHTFEDGVQKQNYKDVEAAFAKVGLKEVAGGNNGELRVWQK